MSLDSVRHVVLVLSGKGGVGKSSVTTQLALSLSLQGHNVGILDVDLTGPSIPRFLGIEDSKVKQAPGGWLPVQVHEQQILAAAPPATYPQASKSTGQQDGEDPNGGAPHGESQQAPTAETKVGALYAMSLAFLLADRGTAIVWRGPKKTAMIRQFLSTTKWPEVDYLLIDTPPGTSDEHISLVETLLKDIGSPSTISTASATDPRDATTTLTAADGAQVRQGPTLSGAVIVTTPQAVSVSDVRKELNFCAKTGVKIIGVVENMSGYICPCCGEEANLFSKGGGQVMAGEFGVPFLGHAPVDPLWGILVEEGKRPRYDVVVANQLAQEAGEENDAMTGYNDTNDGDEARPGTVVREQGLLVDKYRNCSLCPSFSAIARQVAERAETGTAVAVNQV